MLLYYEIGASKSKIFVDFYIWTKLYIYESKLKLVYDSDFGMSLSNSHSKKNTTAT